MKIATLLFTYNRSKHTSQVIAELKSNIIIPEKLYVFQDGLKNGEDPTEWEEVNKLIYSIDWCNKEIIISEYNKGLAESIVWGINYAFKDYEAVIVLEDDCVAMVSFIAFMKQCLEHYRFNHQIYCVSGYAWPIDYSKRDNKDIYFSGRMSSWGWGTWKDRWCEYKRDYDSLRRIKQDKEKSQRLGEWGSDLEDMLVANVRGDINSWAVFWALHIIEVGGYCINPVESLIENIGFDNTGVHCSTSRQFQTKLMKLEKLKFRLPEEVFFEKNVIREFSSIYGNGLIDNNTVNQVLVYGVGEYLRKNEKKIYSKYRVLAFIDQKKCGFRNGIEIIKANKIQNYKYDYIIITLQDVGERNKVRKQLIEQYSVKPEKMLFGA